MSLVGPFETEETDLVQIESDCAGIPIGLTAATSIGGPLPWFRCTGGTVGGVVAGSFRSNSDRDMLAEICEGNWSSSENARLAEIVALGKSTSPGKHS